MFKTNIPYYSRYREHGFAEELERFGPAVVDCHNENGADITC